jgi:hypothetical protein
MEERITFGPPIGVYLPLTEETFRSFNPLWSEVSRLLAKDLGDSFTPFLVVELYRGLICKAFVHTPTDLSLPPQIDEAWHKAILNTELYQEFCMRMFGRFLHHSTITEEDTIENKTYRVNLTKKIYQNVFHTEPPSDLWAIEAPRTFEAAESREEQELLRALEDALHHDDSKKHKSSFQVKVESPSGKNMGRFTVSGGDTISSLKGFIERETCISKDDQRLLFGGVMLQDNRNCHEVGLAENSVILLTLRVRGC